MNEVVFSIGSNFGKRIDSVKKALEWLSSEMSDARASEIYETPDYTGKSTFYINSVLIGHTEEDFESLNSRLKEYEIAQGRTPEMRMRKLVPVDIDIVVWNGDVLRPRDFEHDFFRIGFRQLVDQYLEAR